MSDKYTPTKPCWRPELLNNQDGTPRSPKDMLDMLEPMTPGVMFNKYGTPDGVELALARPDSSVPTFTPWYAEQYLFIGPETPDTPWTPRRTPRSPQTPQTPKINTSNKLYQKHYYWYWLLDPLFNYDNEEQGIIEEIRIDAMVIAYDVISQPGKITEYEDIARDEGVNIPNKRFLDEVFDKLMTKYVGKRKRKRTKLNIVTQIKGGCAYAAASGEVKITDFPIEHFPVMNYDDDDHLDSAGFAGSAGSASPVSPASPAISSELGGSTRRRVKRIKKYKKRTRRRNSKRKSRKSRTTRRR